MDKYYVYQHLVKGKVIYVGFGHDKRAWSYKGRSAAWHKVTVKGFEVEIIESGLTSKRARDLEHYYINGYFELGYKLVNTMLGRQHSIESRKKLSVSHMGQSRPFTEEHRKNISIALTGRKLTEQHKLNVGLGGKGKHIDTEATRLQRSLSHKGKQPGWYKDKEQTKLVAAKISATLKNRNYENRFERIIEKQLQYRFN